MKMKPPTNIREVRQFLGMCGFYRKHIPSFAKIATPLTNLTRSNTVFPWTEECHESFEYLKNSLLNAPILVKAQVDQPLILTTNVKDTHVGGVLSQLQSFGANKPVGYFSKKLNPCETSYSDTDKEAFALKFSSLSLGNPIHSSYRSPTPH